MQALKQLKVVDFSWVGAGPLVTKCLADHGAMVVRVESASAPDVLRLSGPYKDNRRGINRSGLFAIFNNNKHSMTLDLRKPEGLEVARRLVRWADVAVENFSPGTLERLGLPWERLHELNSSLILVRISAQGQTGPHAMHPGYGPLLTGLVGLTWITGWPDRAPSHPAGAQPDFSGARLALVALLAALIQKGKGGEGRCLDISLFEASIRFLEPLVLDYLANGREAQRQGNRSPWAAPHGVYRCRGEDRWCTIGVFSDDEWAAFCEALGCPSWSKELRFASLANRQQHHDELDVLISSWTRQFSTEEVVARLQQFGVRAGVVKNAKDVLEDPQLNSFGFVWPMGHPEMGPVTYFGQPFRLSATPASPRLPSPCLGEHTEFVCRDLLGMSDTEFVGLVNAGAFE